MKIRHGIFFIFFGVLCSSPTISLAQCLEKLKNIPDSASNPRTWDEFYESYRNFGDCGIVGDLAEGYSNSAVKLLANDWEHFDRLVNISQEDQKFKEFVLEHIDATALDDDLIMAVKNAQVRCPIKSKPFCKAIIIAAKRSLLEIKQAVDRAPPGR